MQQINSKRSKCTIGERHGEQQDSHAIPGRSPQNAVDVDEVEEFYEHLVDALLALLYVLAATCRRLFSRFVDAVTRGPHDEYQRD